MKASQPAIPHRQPGVNPLFYLRLLGGLVLEEDGQPVTGRAAQKRRLALLALLAAAPGRAMSRDRLTGMLWPEKDSEQARHLLSVALYEIRKELGDEAVLSRGDEVVLDPLAVGTDLEDFRAALEDGRYDEAAALYQGPFLDGFFLGGSSDFEHWVDSERASIARLQKKALAARAETLEDAGDFTGAADAWRKAANQDRFDSTIALRLLRALDAAGNRAGALQFARIHEALLQEEFGTSPSAEFLEAVKRVRSDTAQKAPAERQEGARKTTTPVAPAEPVTSPPPASSPGEGRVPSPTAAPAPAPAAAVAPPKSTRWRMALIAAALVLLAATAGYLLTGGNGEGPRVLVLPLDTPNPEDAAFADGLTESINDALGQVEGVTVLASTVGFALRGVPAVDAAQRTNADYVVEGSVRRDPRGDSMRVRVALTARHGDAPWSDTYDRPISAYRPTWDEIARAVLAEMHVELGGRPLSGAQGETDDAQARELYHLGRNAWLKRTPEGLRNAVSYYNRAIQRDADYARAHAGLAEVYALMGAYDYGVLHPDTAFPLARREAELALQLAPELAEAHAILASVRFGYDRDWDGAEEAYRYAIQLKPHYAEAHHWYSLFLLARGRPDEAEEEVRRAIELDSLSPVFHASRARQNYFRGDAAASLEGYARALRIEPTFVTALIGAGVALLELGRYDEGIEFFSRGADMVGGTHPLTLALTGNAHGRAGRRDEAQEILTRLEGIRAAGRWFPPEWVALVHIGLGNEDAAIAEFERALENRSNAVAFFGIEPLASPLWDNPRFQALIARGRQPAEEP